MSPRPVASARADERSTRDIILDAAERRFAERGFAGVSVRQIAGEAGLRNQASLYHHFKNKRALYEAVLTRGLAPLIAVISESVRARPDAYDDTFLDRVIDELVKNRHLPRLIQRAGLDDSKYLRHTLTRLFQPFFAQGMDVLNATNSNFTPEELPYLAIGLYHLIFGYFASSALLEAVLLEDPTNPAAIARQRKFLKSALILLLSGSPPTPTTR